MEVVAIQGMLYSRNFGDILLADIVVKWLREAGVKVVAPMASPSVASDIGLPLPAGMAAFLKHSKLLLTGGGYFGLPLVRPFRKEAAMIARYTFPALAVRLRGGSYAVIGVGVSNLEGNLLGRYMRQFFEAAAVVSVRDSASVAALRAIGVRREIVELSDLALSLTSDQIPREDLSRARAQLEPLRARHDRLIVLHLAERPGAKGYDPIYEAIRRFAALNPHSGFVLVEDHPSGIDSSQAGAIAALEEMLPGRSLHAPYLGHWALVALLSIVDGLVTNKLHTAIVCASFNKPTFAIAKHQKNHNFFRQIGAEERCVDLGVDDVDDILSRLQRFLIEDPYGATVPEAVRQRAHAHRALVQAFAGN